MVVTVELGGRDLHAASENKRQPAVRLVTELHFANHEARRYKGLDSAVIWTAAIKR